MATSTGTKPSFLDIVFTVKNLVIKPDIAWPAEVKILTKGLNYQFTCPQKSGTNQNLQFI